MVGPPASIRLCPRSMRQPLGNTIFLPVRPCSIQSLLDNGTPQGAGRRAPLTYLLPSYLFYIKALDKVSCLDGTDLSLPACLPVGCGMQKAKQTKPNRDGGPWTYLERSTESAHQASGLCSVNGDICRLSRLIMSCHDVVMHVTAALDVCEIRATLIMYPSQKEVRGGGKVMSCHAH